MRWLAAVASALLISCASASAPSDASIPADWLQIAQTPRYPNLSYDKGGVLLYEPRTPVESGVHIAKTDKGAKLVNGDKDLTPELAAIDSFDVSLDRKEVAFSAKRTDNFDIGLVALEGSPVSWVPQDPSDEIAVQYAPRGNKISYVVRARGGDLVRCVHIPTAMQLSVDFPYGRVDALAWEPRAERYAVSWSSADASERIELTKYSGEERKTLVPPAVTLDVTPDSIGGAVVLRPSAMRYGEKLPLVVWRTADRNAWSDARGAMERAVPVACAILDRDPDDEFWNAIAKVPWIDSSRVFVIGAGPRPRSVPSSDGSRQSAVGNRIWVVGDPSVPSGVYRTRQNVLSVAPALVQSFGAAWVTQQLKGNPPANGSHR